MSATSADAAELRGQAIERATSAAMIAPLVAPLPTLAVLAGALLWDGSLARLSLESLVSFAGYALAVGYVLMFVVGLPAFVLLNRLRLASVWTAILAGYGAAIAPILPFILFGDWKVGGLTSELLSALTPNVYTLTVAIVGLAFWLLYRRAG